jgi:hypothetical protein
MNLLDQASRIDDRDAAVALIANALSLEPNSGCVLQSLSDRSRWARVGRETRLAEIGEWIRLECSDAMDLVAEKTPMQTVGTND